MSTKKARTEDHRESSEIGASNLDSVAAAGQDGNEQRTQINQITAFLDGSSARPTTRRTR
jgi:hypothetical protein